MTTTSIVALPYPLPEQAQRRLIEASKSPSRLRYVIEELRKEIGVVHRREEFRPVGEYSPEVKGA